MLLNLVKPIKLEDCILHCIGHGTVNDSMPSEERFHAKYYELTIITDGEGVIYTSDVPTAVKKNDIYLSFPFDVHRIEAAAGKNIEYDYVGFSVSSQKFGDEFNRIWSDNIATVNRVFSNSSVLEILDSIHKELEANEKAFSNELLSLLFSQLLVHVLRSFSEQNREKKDAMSGNVGLCGLVMNYVDTHLYTMKSLREMAQDLGYNYSYLSTIFHKTTRTTLNGYYKTKRMEAAQRLLSESKMTVSKVAELMNYSTVYAFSKAFKEHFGDSPSHYSGKNSHKD